MAPAVTSSEMTTERGPSPTPKSGLGKYQIWPSSFGKIPKMLSSSSERSAALAAGRSPSSLSDTAASPPTQHAQHFWSPGGSFSRRRKVSVPEIGSVQPATPMTTVQEVAVDSPTIPGRPPLRKTASENNVGYGHERSASAPGNDWRSGPFGDALVHSIAGPAPTPAPTGPLPIPRPLANNPPRTDFGALINSTPLSPILSPPASTASTPRTRPTLKLDTEAKVEEEEEEEDTPPEVPPKSPYLERKFSPSPGSRHVATMMRSATPVLSPPGSSATNGGKSPSTQPISAVATPVVGGASMVTSPVSINERRSPTAMTVKFESSPISPHGRNASESSISIMERGRPPKKSTSRSRLNSDAADQGGSPKPDTWDLPRGVPAMDAYEKFSPTDRELLRRQAEEQAENFEVLSKRDVHSLSRELRAIDERCEYLRRTHKNLRMERQKLHTRIISILRRGESVAFSREALLKQEEALAEFDQSIDDWILKLEQAENRRLRIRQKLLEHVAGALVPQPAGGFRHGSFAESTPPRSPTKAEPAANTGAAANNRSESIRIYADGQVLDLFADVELTMGKMCESR